MARTFADLQNEIAFDEFDPNKTVNGLSYRSLFRTWINEAAQHISREVQLPQLETSVTVTQTGATYTLPANVQVVTSVFAGPSRLDEVDISEIDEMNPAAGKPYMFAVYGPSLVFYPTPSAVEIVVRFEGGLADLGATADGVALEFPDDFLDLLVHYGRMRAFAMEDDFEGSQFHQQWWERGLARMRSQMQLRSRGRKRQVRGMLTGVQTYPRFTRP